MKAVEVINIIKRYGSKKNLVEALHGISFAVERRIVWYHRTRWCRKDLPLPHTDDSFVAGWRIRNCQWLDVVKEYKSIRKQVGYMPGRFSL